MPMPNIIIIILFGIMIIFLYFIEPFFNRNKLSDNNEHGSARWANKKDIEKNFRVEDVRHIKQSGFPVFFSRNCKKVWFDNKTPHWICLGSTGSGKSVTSVIPYCSFIATAEKKKSVFITDPKGEIFKKTSLMFKNNGYDVISIDFRNPEFSNHINLLEPIIQEYELYDKYSKLVQKETNEELLIDYNNKSIKHLSNCNQLVEDISKMIMNDETAKEKFWSNSSSDLLYGLIFLFLEDYVDGKIKRNQITLSSIKKFQASSMSEKNNKKLKSYVEKRSYSMKSKDKLENVLNINDVTYRSITSTFSERMSLYDNLYVENITHDSDFDLGSIGRKPTVIYCCVPDESPIFYSLVSLIVSTLYKTLVSICNESKDDRLPNEIVFLLDEFGNTPPLADISSMTSVGRSRGMYFVYYLQSFQQLDRLYGKEVSRLVQDNCGLAFLKTNNHDTAEEISAKLGTHGVETTSLNYSNNFRKSGGGGKNLISRRLMTADEIERLKYETIIFSMDCRPIRRKTILYNKFKCYQKGCMERQIRPLKRYSDSYYTVNDIKLSNILNSKLSLENELVKQTLNKIIDNIIKMFGKIDYDIEYVVDNNKLSSELYLAPPLSLSDLYQLESFSKEYKFRYTAISDKNEIDKEGRNSKIILELL